MRVLLLLACTLLSGRLRATEVAFYTVTGHCPLTTPVAGLQGSFPSRLAALIHFGRVQRILLAIELTASMVGPVNLDVPAETVRSVVKAILGHSGLLILTCLDTVVLVRDRHEAEPRWLRARVPEFQIARSSLAMANAALWMRVEQIEDPAARGFAGSVPGIRVL